MSEVYLITGANSGLGLETVKRLVMMPATRKIYMACRSEEKAQTAMEMIKTPEMDMSKLHYLHYDAYSTREVLFQTPDALGGDQLTGVILNAGGIGHDTTQKPVPPNQVLDIYQINVVAHLQLLEAIKPKLAPTCRIVYSGSEAALGLVPSFLGLPPPTPGDTPEWYKDQLQGRPSDTPFDAMAVYGSSKAFAALYFAEWARRNPSFQVLVVSPGATTSNTGASSSTQSSFDSGNLPWHMKTLMPLLMPVMRWWGQMHSLEDGTARYVDAVTGQYDERFASGTFVASAKGATGHVVDQTTLPAGKLFANVDKQKAAFEALSVYTTN